MLIIIDKYSFKKFKVFFNIYFERQNSLYKKNKYIFTNLNISNALVTVPYQVAIEVAQTILEHDCSRT
jgi:hypothetical protein